jgi:hypothetical protein
MIAIFPECEKAFFYKAIDKRITSESGGKESAMALTLHQDARNIAIRVLPSRRLQTSGTRCILSKLILLSSKDQNIESPDPPEDSKIRQCASTHRECITRFFSCL